MDQLNIYQKIRIILLIIIIIETIIFAISIVKAKNSENQEEIEEVVAKIEESEIENEESEENEDDTSWDEEDVQDSEVDMEDEENSEENNSASYYLKVNYTANVVTAYTKDSSGKYTVPVRAMICSTGTATPRSGVYATSDKYRWHQLNGGVYGQYCTRITGHILFHSVPYKTNSPDSLKYTAYDKLGTAASSGCIRLTVEDALWIYSNCASGTYVEFYSSSDPGPLGKPTAKKISSVTECRDWDPTDPDSRNPWHSYTGSTESTSSSTSSSSYTTTTEETSSATSQETTQSEQTTTQEEKQPSTEEENLSDTQTEDNENNTSSENNTNSEAETEVNETNENNTEEERYNSQP